VLDLELSICRLQRGAGLHHLRICAFCCSIGLLDSLFRARDA
jgi:hypothetical protein